MLRSSPGPIVRALLALLTLTAAVAADDYENPRFGFRLDLGDDWLLSGEDGDGAALHLTLSGRGELLRCQLQIHINSAGTRADPEAMRAGTVALIDATVGYDNPQLCKRQVASRSAPSLVCNTSAAGFPGIMRQAYLAENDWLYVLQDFHPTDGDEQLIATLDRLWETFEFIPLDAEASRQQRLLTLAGRCGSEIDWADDWHAAAERAQRLQRPVLVHARMYRGFSISDDTMSGAFMDRDVIELVNSRCVPLAVVETSGLPFADTSAYGLGPLTFGSACLLVSPAGNVLWDGFTPADVLLRKALADIDDLRGTPVNASADTFEQALAHMRRGELEQVLAVLDVPRNAAEQRLISAVHRRRLEGDAALAVLDAAENAPGAVPLQYDLDVDRVELLLATGKASAADALAATLLARAPRHERVPELLLLRAAVALSERDRDTAQALLERVIAQHGETRWAWAAAATLTSTAWAMEQSESSVWPDHELIEQLRPPTFAALAVERWPEAQRHAIDWLLDAQNADGSWPQPSNLGRRANDPPHDFDLAAAALATSALLPHRDEAAVRAAIDGAVAWLAVAYPQERDAEPELAFMDYAVWSRACLLITLADLVDCGLGTLDEWSAMARSLHDELAVLSKPGGGWSYYLTGDVTAASPMALQSMSFTNALIVLSLQRANAAELIDGHTLAESGLDSLDRGRLADGSFRYMVPPPGGPSAKGERGDAGSAGRGPVCTLAMVRAGRLPLPQLRDALDTFIEHKGSYTRERGKHLMHAGAQGQGSHYLLFDYATAAWAVAALPLAERAAYVEPLLEMVLSSRTSAGSFIDNPIIGAASATSLALSAFTALQLEP